MAKKAALKRKAPSKPAGKVVRKAKAFLDQIDDAINAAAKALNDDEYLEFLAEVEDAASTSLAARKEELADKGEDDNHRGDDDD